MSPEVSSQSKNSASPVRYVDVTKRYDGADSDAVSHLDLEIPAGEICVLVGPSGCGKTTAMRALKAVLDTTGAGRLIPLATSAHAAAILGAELGVRAENVHKFLHDHTTQHPGRITLAPGQRKRVTFHLAANQLGFYDRRMDFVIEPGTVEVMVGSSSEDIRAAGSFEITGAATTIGAAKAFFCTVDVH